MTYTSEDLRECVRQWYDERVVAGSPVATENRAMYRDYRHWAGLHGVPAAGPALFGICVTSVSGERSITARDRRGGFTRVRRGIALRRTPAAVLRPAPAGTGTDAERGGVSFFSYLRRRSREGTPVGDLARDVAFDRDVRCSMATSPAFAYDERGRTTFGTDPCRQPEPATVAELIDYLRWHGACGGALDAAAAAWTDYLRWRGATGSCAAPEREAA